MKILDCTIRDGGYVNNWQFEKIFRKYYQLMLDLNIDFIEIGFNNIDFEYKNRLTGKFRYLDNNFLKKFEDILVKEKNAIMINYEDYDSNKLKICNECQFSIIRIAFHKKDYVNALKLCKELKDKGFIISANLMKTDNYSKDEMLDLLKIYKKYDLDYIYIADSFGNMYYDDIIKYYNVIKTFDQSIKIGVHLHNSYQNAFSNFVNIHKFDIEIIDCTLFGMGRGSGNLPLELILSSKYLKTPKNDIKKLLIFIADNILPENGYPNWGYSIDYLFAAYLNLHPTYVSKLRDMKIPYSGIIELLDKIKSNNILNFDNNILLNELNNYYSK